MTRGGVLTGFAVTALVGCGDTSLSDERAAILRDGEKSMLEALRDGFDRAECRDRHFVANATEIEWTCTGQMEGTDQSRDLCQVRIRLSAPDKLSMARCRMY